MAKPKCHKCEEKCGKGKVNPEIVNEMELAFRTFLASNSNSLLRKYLTVDLFNKLKTKKTSFGNSLLDCAKSGFENPDSGIGLYAADPDCYTLYADLFDQIILDYHGFKKSYTHPPTDWGDIKAIKNLDPKGEYIVSTRIRCARMLDGYPFNPSLDEEKYQEIESKIGEALSSLEGDLQGVYYPLDEMLEETKQQLIDDHFLFKEGDRFLQSANACRFWPEGRGIYFNENKTFIVWVNEEDHMRIISLEQGGNLGDIYARLVLAATELENRLKFMKNERFGYLTFCPTNLGTTIRSSVHIKLPKLAKNMAKLNELADKLNLQVRGTSGEHSEAIGGVYDVSNKRRLGLTEFQVVKEMFDGILELIGQEKSIK